MKIDETLNYYNNNAKEFISGTKDVIFSTTQDMFLSYLEKGATILDFGCGSGRDSKYFLDKGYKVFASDGSTEICKITSEYLGMEVKNILFNELEDIDMYDGVWACSSLLHLNRELLKDAFNRVYKALKDKGVLYTSFKYGNFEGIRNGRYFIDFTAEDFEEFLIDCGNFNIEKIWITNDVRAGRENEKWLNLILSKK